MRGSAIAASLALMIGLSAGAAFAQAAAGHPEIGPVDAGSEVELLDAEGDLVASAAEVEALAEEKGCTPAQIALAWLLAQGPDVIPIPGTKRIERLEENLGALNVRLTPAEIDRISTAIPIGAAAGTRYPEGGMRGVYI